MTKTLDNSSSKQVARNAAGQILPGQSLNPLGRPVGSHSGIRAALQIVLDVANRNQDVIRRALQDEAEKHPFRFARQFILPATPHKFRKDLRARIRAAEQAAFDKAQIAFNHNSESDLP